MPLRRSITKLFDTDEFWQQVAAKCISCGACTYLCPTCYCFNITDEQTRDKGERLQDLGRLHVPAFYAGGKRSQSEAR